jgi:prepilin-type processing-associated H-X9-DG protein
MKLTAISRPPARVLIYEENAPNDEWSLGCTCVADLPSGRHGTAAADQGTGQAAQSGSPNNIWLTAGRGNFCFFDGHVESLSPSQMMLDVQQNWNNRYSPLNQ